MAIETIIKIWRCEKCGEVHTKEHLAERCCVNKSCEDCGCSLDPKWYMTVCTPCRNARLFEEAEKITYEEYVKRFPGHMVVHDDSYYSGIEDLLYCLECEDVPTYVWATDEALMAVDMDLALEQAEEDAYENAEFSSQGKKEFRNFVEAWNNEYAVKYYVENNKTAVLVPEELVEEYFGGRCAGR